LFVFASKYGLIGAGVSIAAVLLFFVLDSSVPAFVNPIVILAVLIWGQLDYRKVGVPPIGYGEVLGVGVLVILWFATVTMIFNMIHWSFIDTEMTTRVLQQLEQTLSEQGLSESDAKVAMDMQQMMIGPIMTPVMGFLGLMLAGTLASLITSIFTRKSATE